MSTERTALIVAFTGLFVALSSTAGLLWDRSRERAGEVKKDQEHVSVPAPAFGPVPNVVVQSMPAPTITEPPSTTAPTPAPVIKRRPIPKHTAAKKLQSKWVAPEAKPFDIKDLFK